MNMIRVSWLALSLGLGAGLLPGISHDGNARAADMSPEDLEKIQNDIKAADTRQKTLESQTKSVEAEAGDLRKRLIDVTARVQAREEDINTAQTRLEGLGVLERKLSTDLERRKAQIGDLLAALVRVQSNPPPALFVKPGDAVSAARSAMLLGATVPELRAEALDLAKQIEELQNVRAALVSEHERLKTAQSDLAREQKSLDAMLTDRLARQKALSAQAENEKKSLTKLSAEATSLKDLIASLERDAARNVPVMRPIEGPPPEPAPAPVKKPPVVEQIPQTPPVSPAQAPTAAPETINPLDLPADSPLRPGGPVLLKPQPTPEMPAPAQTPTPAQAATTQAPVAAPATAAAILSAPTPMIARPSSGLPVSGRIVTAYGSRTDGGGASQGIMIATRAGAPVIAPRDGRIAFAGPFRRYGQLLIIQTSEGYHVVLAGMAEVTGNVGQDVLAGEPVGIMGSGSTSGIADVSTGPSGSGAGSPALYVEIRKNGETVNPAIWLGRR